MPLYVFKCKWCGTTKEVLLPSNKYIQFAMETTPCPKCRKREWEKLPTIPFVHFKGAGFYETDYKKSVDNDD